MALVNDGRRRRLMMQLGDFLPGSGPATEIELAQRGLKSIGFDVDITGQYDAKTVTAVLEFRGAAGLPYVHQIDDAFLERLWTEVDAAGNTANLPPGLKIGGTTQDPISITGAAGAGIGLLVALGLAYALSKKKGGRR